MDISCSFNDYQATIQRTTEGRYKVRDYREKINLIRKGKENRYFMDVWERSGKRIQNGDTGREYREAHS